MKTSLDELREVYQYTSLPRGKYVRYLTLEPGEYTSPIRCNLHTGRLDDMPYFEAISYVWGSSDRNIPISCDGATLYITENLSNVLRQVRKPHEPRTIWADSICINQQDVVEKGVQVDMMGQLYSRADRVLICLGSNDATGGADRVASLIATVDEMIQKGLKNIKDKSISLPFLSNDDPILQDEKWSSFRELLEEPWFERGWTVQEAGLAKDARILWGNVEIDWRTLLRLCWWVKCRATMLSGKWHLFGLTALHLLRYPIQHKHEATTISGAVTEKVDFLEYLDGARSLKLYDPRDRIYAFLGFRNQESGFPSLTPDYQKSFEAVYIELACQYIKHTKDASILHFIDHDESTLYNDELASWVPNWTTYAHQENVSGSLPLIEHPSGFESVPKMDSEGLLQVRAAICDTVRYASDKLHWGSTAISEVVSIWTKISSMDGATPYTSVAPLEAFATVLTADRFRTSKMQCHMFAYMLRLHEGTTPGSAGDCTREELDIIKIKSIGGNLLIHQDNVRSLGHNRRVIMTQRGFYGLAPGTVREGDVCALIFGGTQTPFMLRETERPGCYKVMGDAFIAGPHKDTRTGSPIVLGAGSFDWVDWGIQDQEIFLC